MPRTRRSTRGGSGELGPRDVSLGKGTLPPEVFQDYLVQDFHFLVQFARANALAAFKSRTPADITAAHAATGAILAETRLHLQLTERWGIDRARLEAAPEKQATVAYTRYVLDCGMVGDVLDQLDALAAGGLTDRRLDELTEVFRTASRLEADFWQQALDSVG